jgi:hypothetical protein
MCRRRRRTGRGGVRRRRAVTGRVSARGAVTRHAAGRTGIDGRQGRGQDRAGRAGPGHGRQNRNAYSVAAGVHLFDLHHQGHIRCRVVVTKNRGDLSLIRSEVTSCCAQVGSGRRGGVEDVERVLDTVPIGVDPPGRPGGRNELHRPDGAVIDGVTVEATTVGIADDRGAVAVQRDAHHGWGRQAVGVQHGAGEPTMVGLDPADPGKQRPADSARRGQEGLPGDRLLVGRERCRRDAARGERRSRPDAGAEPGLRNRCGGSHDRGNAHHNLAGIQISGWPIRGRRGGRADGRGPRRSGGPSGRLVVALGDGRAARAGQDEGEDREQSHGETGSDHGFPRRGGVQRRHRVTGPVSMLSGRALGPVRVARRVRHRVIRSYRCEPSVFPPTMGDHDGKTLNVIRCQGRRLLRSDEVPHWAPE